MPQAKLEKRQTRLKDAEKFFEIRKLLQYKAYKNFVSTLIQIDHNKMVWHLLRQFGLHAVQHNENVLCMYVSLNRNKYFFQSQKNQQTRVAKGI